MRFYRAAVMIALPSFEQANAVKSGELEIGRWFFGSSPSLRRLFSATIASRTENARNMAGIRFRYLTACPKLPAPIFAANAMAIMYRADGFSGTGDVSGSINT